MADPSIPSYASGTISLMSTDIIYDSATNTTGSTTTPQLRAIAVGTFNADWNNWALSTGVPKGFPGLQT